MGKKRVVVKSGGAATPTVPSGSTAKGKRRLEAGCLHIQATYNNTKLALHDLAGNLVVWATSGGLGFSGAKKGTTFAAGKVGERLAEYGEALGLKEVAVVIKGVGAGREAALRAFASRGINLVSIKDATPVPFNGPKPRKPRRV